MRPGPGLVVMALAFISGARRGSTNTSSKTSPSSPSLSLSSESSSSASTSSLLSSSSSSSSSSASYNPLLATIDQTFLYPSFPLHSSSNSGYFPTSVDATKPKPPPQPPEIGNTATNKQNQQRRLNSEDLANGFYHYYYKNYPPPLEGAKRFQLKNLEQKLPKAFREIRSTLAIANAAKVKQADKIDEIVSGENIEEDTSDTNPVFDSSSSSSTGGSSSSSSSSSSDRNSADSESTSEGLLVQFPSLVGDPSSRSFDTDNILALVAEDDLLSEESFDRLKKLTDDKVVYINEEGESEDVEDYGGSSSSSSNLNSGTERDIFGEQLYQTATEDDTSTTSSSSSSSSSDNSIQSTTTYSAIAATTLNEDDSVDSESSAVSSIASITAATIDSEIDERSENLANSAGADGDDNDNDDNNQEIDGVHFDGSDVYAANLVSNNELAATAANGATILQTNRNNANSLSRSLSIGDTTAAASSTAAAAAAAATQTTTKRTDLRKSLFNSESPLTRLNPWISACDLAQPGTAPDLQGQCSSGTLPMAWVDEGPGPPTCPKSCEQLRLANKHKKQNSNSENIKTTTTTTNNNNNNNKNLNIKNKMKYLINTETNSFKLSKNLLKIVSENNQNLNQNQNQYTYDDSDKNLNIMKVRRDLSNNLNKYAATAATTTTTTTTATATKTTAATTAAKTTATNAADATIAKIPSKTPTTSSTAQATATATQTKSKNTPTKRQKDKSHNDNVDENNNNNNNDHRFETDAVDDFINSHEPLIKYDYLRLEPNANSNSNSKNDDNDVNDEDNEKDEQCLDYLGDTKESSPVHLCSLKSPIELMTQLRTLRLRHCCERNVLSALHTLALNATLSGGTDCVRILTDIMDLDALATRITCELAEILFRFDCRQVYSLVNQCDDCKEAYRRWVCSTLIPFFVEPSDVIINDYEHSADITEYYKRHDTTKAPTKSSPKKSKTVKRATNTSNVMKTATQEQIKIMENIDSGSDVNVDVNANNNKRKLVNNNMRNNKNNYNSNSERDLTEQANKMMKATKSVASGSNSVKTAQNYPNLIINDDVANSGSGSDGLAVEVGVDVDMDAAMGMGMGGNNAISQNKMNENNFNYESETIATKTKSEIRLATAINNAKCRRGQPAANDVGHNNRNNDDNDDDDALKKSNNYFISTANNMDQSYCADDNNDPVISKLLKRTKRKVEFRKRRRIRPCLNVCQTVEQKCPYMLPADRAPALPTQYAGEPTFSCLDQSIPETGEQLRRSSYGPKDCCYSYCGDVFSGICAYCTEFAMTGIVEVALTPNSTATTPRRVHNYTLLITRDKENQQMNSRVSLLANDTNARAASVEIALRNASSAVDVLSRLSYYAYYDGTYYYDDELNDMPDEALSEHCPPVPSVTSRCTIPYYASGAIATTQQQKSSQNTLLLWLSVLMCTISGYNANRQRWRCRHTATDSNAANTNSSNNNSCISSSSSNNYQLVTNNLHRQQRIVAYLYATHNLLAFCYTNKQDWPDSNHLLSPSPAAAAANFVLRSSISKICQRHANLQLQSNVAIKKEPNKIQPTRSCSRKLRNNDCSFTFSILCKFIKINNTNYKLSNINININNINNNNNNTNKKRQRIGALAKLKTTTKKQRQKFFSKKFLKRKTYQFFFIYRYNFNIINDWWHRWWWWTHWLYANRTFKRQCRPPHILVPTRNKTQFKYS